MLTYSIMQHLSLICTDAKREKKQDNGIHTHHSNLIMSALGFNKYVTTLLFMLTYFHIFTIMNSRALQHFPRGFSEPNYNYLQMPDEINGS